MTRINVIPPADLTDQHLLAEYRELPRVFTLAAAAAARGDAPAPAAYTLGAGHVRFFFRRTLYLHRRQAEIIRELLDRGYALAHTAPPEPLDDGDWTPDEAAVAANLGRLREKLAAPPRPGFYTLRGVAV